MNSQGSKNPKLIKITNDSKDGSSYDHGQMKKEKDIFYLCRGIYLTPSKKKDY